MSIKWRWVCALQTEYECFYTILLQHISIIINTLYTNLCRFLMKATWYNLWSLKHMMPIYGSILPSARREMVNTEHSSVDKGCHCLANTWRETTTTTTTNAQIFRYTHVHVVRYAKFTGIDILIAASSRRALQKVWRVINKIDTHRPCNTPSRSECMRVRGGEPVYCQSNTYLEICVRSCSLVCLRLATGHAQSHAVYRIARLRPCGRRARNAAAHGPAVDAHAHALQFRDARDAHTHAILPVCRSQRNRTIIIVWTCGRQTTSRRSNRVGPGLLRNWSHVL